MNRIAVSNIEFESWSPIAPFSPRTDYLISPTETLENFSFVVLTVVPSSDLPRENKGSVETVMLILIEVTVSHKQ